MPDYLKTGKDMLEAQEGFQLIGRDAELSSLCSILVRKHSNSILLVGPSGVGASSICLGLQAMKSDDNPPFDIISKSIFWLDTDALFSTGDPSAIDNAFRKATDRLKRSVEPVLIIEDAGDFLDACQNNGASHFVNLINAAVCEGRLQVILETSDKDAAKVLSWHSDLREAYTILDVTEPTGENLTLIVEATAQKLQDFHKVKIDADAVASAVELTQKYRGAGSSAAQPKRSIELLDQAMASYRLAAHKIPPQACILKKKIDAGTATAEDNAEYQRIMQIHSDRQGKLKALHRQQREAEEVIIGLEGELEALRNAPKEEAPQAPAQPVSFAALTSGAGFGSSREQEISERLMKFRKALDEHRKGYDALAGEMNEELHLDRSAVVAEFSRISGIAASKLGEDELLVLRNLDATLRGGVFGQDRPVSQIANAIKVARVGRRNKDRPQASFLLPGPSGVGKTEIAKQIAKALPGDAKALTRFDMSEYMERHAVSKLIGAPPGYEGFEAGGILTNAMRTNRNRVLLFDEIEKAHPDVFNLFLQILDDGRLTDNIGRVAEFSDSIIIMTTNIGQPHFLDTGLTHDEAMAAVMEDLGASYRPEFLNRFNGRQNILGFNRLELDSIVKIIKREFDDLATSYAEHGVAINFADDQIKAFCEDRYDPVIGARGLPGQVNTELEPQIVNALLDQSATGGASFNVNYDTIGRGFVVDLVRAMAA